MPLSFAEQLSGIQKSRTLAISLERAYDYARESGRDEVTLEHLLLALTEDGEAIAVLAACDVDLDRLRTDVAGYLGRSNEAPTSGSDPVAAPALLRTIKHAEAAAKQSGRPQLNGGIVLAAIVGDGKSNAAELLQGQGLTFQGTLKALQTSTIAATSAAAPSQSPARKPTPAKVEPAPAPAASEPTLVSVTTPIENASGLAEPKGSIAETQSPVSTAADAPSTEDVLASVRERIEAKSRGTTRRPPTAQTTEPDASPVQGQPVPVPQPAGITTGRGGPQGPAPSPAQLADKWARAIDGPDTIPHNPDAPQAAAGQTGYTGSYPEAVNLDAAGGATAGNPQPAPVPAAAAPAMEPWPEPRDQQLQPPPPAAPSPDMPVNGSIAGRPYSAANDAAAPVSYTPAPSAPPRAPAPQPAGPRQTRPGQAPAMPAAAAPQRQPQPGVRARAAAATVESGQLLETIPRFMKVAIPATVEVRIARDNVEAPGKGMQGRAPVQRHDLLVTKAMSVKLKAPDGGFWIETASPETQWIENKLGLLHDDFASWRWTVTPRRRGTARLQLVVSARTVGTDGLAAETQLPDQVVTVKVRMNYKKSFKKLGGWALAALVGGIISALGSSLLTGGGLVQDWLARIGL